MARGQGCGVTSFAIAKCPNALLSESPYNHFLLGIHGGNSFHKLHHFRCLELESSDELYHPSQLWEGRGQAVLLLPL